jgi:DNA-binding response OmpR family regulator
MTKILVFESEPAFAWELRTELGRLGCTVQIVDDGNAGLQSAANDRPDLILLSIELPRMNGFSVCNKLKKDPQLKDVPLIIMSSDSSEETFDQHRRLKTRAEDYVRKPIALGELVAHIKQLVPITAAIEPDSILIDDPVVFDDEVEDLGAPAEETEGQQPRKASATEVEIDDFLGGAFDRMIGDEEPKAIASAKKHPASLRPDPPTIPAPPPPPPPQPPIILAPMPPPPPPPPVVRSGGPDASTPARSPSVPPPPRTPRSAVSKGPVTTRSVPPASVPLGDVAALSSSSQDSIEELRLELSRNKDEITRLHLALDASRSNVQFLESRALEPQQDSDENVRLKHEIEELKSKLAVAAASAPARAGSSREFLDLRETLNKKDKEILSLRDQLTSKDKELLEVRDSALTLERDKADLSDRSAELERTCEDLAGKIEKLKEDRYILGMRAENFEGLTAKLEAKLLARDVEATARVEAIETSARARVTEVEEALEREKTAREEALSLLEETRRAVAEAEARVVEVAEQAARHQAEKERLSAENAALVEKHAHEKESLSAEHAALVEKHASEIRALTEAHAEQVDAAHESEIANLRQEHANESEQLAAAHAAELEAVRQDQHRALEKIKAEHAAAVAALTAAAEERLAARNREFAEEWVRGAAQLETLHGDALKQAEHDAAERVRAEVVEHYENKLRALESKHATDIETIRAERDRAIEELDAASRSAVQELDRYVIGLGADLQDTRIKLEDTEEQRAALSAEVVRLKSERASQVAQLERLENDLRASKEEVVSIGAEKDRFAAEAKASASRVARLRNRLEQDRLALEQTREALTQVATRLQELETRPLEED